MNLTMDNYHQVTQPNVHHIKRLKQCPICSGLGWYYLQRKSTSDDKRFVSESATCIYCVNGMVVE